jgi:NitT/TauT family transport system ATP-binding protein
MRKSFILLEDVSFSYGRQNILRGLRLELEQGTSYALIGASGVGKSTLLHLLAGFLKPDSGRILINNHPLSGPRKETAFLFQELGLFPWQTVWDAVSMPLRVRGNRADMQDKVTLLLKELGILQYKDKYPGELSGGEQQRVALARTLIGEPDLLLMDEPTSALDAMTKELLQQLILREIKKRQTTLIFITHDIEEAVLLGERLLLLKEDGTITEYKNEYYGVPEAREEIGFYQECIRIRKLLKQEDNQSCGNQQDDAKIQRSQEDYALLHTRQQTDRRISGDGQDGGRV